MKKNKTIILILTAILIALSLISLTGGATKIPVKETIQAIKTKDTLTKTGRIIHYIRLPRTKAAILSGIALSTAGVILQTILNNPLAGPNIIGINTGAKFTLILISIIAPTAYNIYPLSAFIGAMITVSLVYLLGKITGSSKLTIILSGIAINSFLNGLIDLVYSLSDKILLSSYNFKIGSLNAVNQNVLPWASLIIILSALITYHLHNQLEILSLGDETAKSLGLNANYYRGIYLTLTATMVGAATSIIGIIGFIGLITPHIARQLVGSEAKYQIPATALIGANMMLLCDYIGRTIHPPYEIPVSIILSIIGSPYFIYILLKRKK